MKGISIHAPVKGATIFANSPDRGNWDFNPRTREGCDDFCLIKSLKFCISIHAPVKGATTAKISKDGKSRISIHAPVKGATRIGFVCVNFKTYFNPRTREGCDVVT